MPPTAHRSARGAVVRVATIIAIAASAASAATAAAAAGLDPRLAPLAPYVDRVFTANMGPAGNEAATVDVQEWETILGGKAVRITHSINGGDYGGESLIMWDVAQQAITYWYVTTADFYTHGTITAAGDSLVTREQVVGNAGNISEVEGVWRRTADGHTVESRMMVGGQWQPKRTSTYRETPGAAPTFR